MSELVRAQSLLFACRYLNLMPCNVRFRRIRTVKPVNYRPGRKEELCVGETKPENLGYQGGKKGQIFVRGEMENVLRGLGLSQRQFVEQNPLMEEDIDEFDDTIIHGEEFFDMHHQEEKARKSFIEKKRTIRKYFHEPPETNLLTVAAKEQIRYLHSLDPVVWDAQKLSESFPISVNGVKKLLRSKFLSMPTERRQKHDRSVTTNIELLKEGKEGISPITQRLWKEGKLKLEYSVGNVNLPMPSRNETNKSLQLQTKKFPEKVGQFLSIVKPYLDLKEKEKLSNNSSDSTISENEQCNKNENLWEIRVIPSADRNMEDNCDDPLCASYLAHKIDKSDPDVTFEKIKKGVSDRKTFISSNKTSDDTRNKPYNRADMIDEDVPKYEDDTIELKIDCRRGSLVMVPYLYDSKHGYQHPVGEPPEYPNKIVIPRHLYKPGCKYKVGNCYYDDEGNFLYRTFA